MKILLTGASGLLGANIAHELHQRGHTIRVLARPGSNLQTISTLPYELASGDVTDIDSVRKATKGCDAVIHAAAVTGPSPTHFSFYEPVNLQGTINMVEAAREYEVQRFIYVSTADTLGFGSKEQPGDEWSEYGLYKFDSGYANSKYLAQQYVLEQAALNVFPAIVVNPSFLIGPFDQKPSTGKIILRGLGSGMQFCPPGGKSFISVKDAAYAIGQALTKGEIGECYLLGGENLSFGEFFQVLNDVTGHRGIQITIPGWLLRGLGYTAGAFSWLSNGNGDFNAVNARLLCQGYYYNCDKARRELDLPQTPIREAIREAVEWFLDAGMLPQAAAPGIILQKRVAS